MKKNTCIFWFGSLIVLSLACIHVGATVSGNLPLPKQSPTPEQDTVYSENEVDVKAQMLNLADISPINSGASLDCENNAEVRLTIVLRKGGKVTDVKIVKSARCSLDRKAIQSAKRIKFKPAEKGEIAVSQLTDISFRQNRVK